jgi:hypothetical protein
MKRKLITGLLMAGSCLFAAPVFAAPRIAVGIGVGAGVPLAGYGYYGPAPAPAYAVPAYVQAPAPALGYTWVGGYWYGVGPGRVWRPGYWAAPRAGFRARFRR